MIQLHDKTISKRHISYDNSLLFCPTYVKHFQIVGHKVFTPSQEINSIDAARNDRIWQTVRSAKTTAWIKTFVSHEWKKRKDKERYENTFR